MARAPFQVLVYPYRKAEEKSFEYALLKRADSGYWHAVAGGGEGDETPLEAASRETSEEIGVSGDLPFLQLDTVLPVPVTAFKDSFLWGEDVYVIPQYCFGVLVQKDHIVLSSEHTDCRWLKYHEAHRMVKYEGNKIALWELDRRLRGLGPRE